MHETTLLLIEVGALLLGMSLLGRLALLIGISPIPFYLLLGLAFGEGGLVPLDASNEFLADRLRDRHHPAARPARARVHRDRALREPQVRTLRRASSTPC